jgi:signal peptidase I
MHIPPLPTSRWFIYVSTGLLVFLCLAILLAGMILFVQSSQVRMGQIAGSSMEPTLQGPRLLVKCDTCQKMNAFSIDAWNPMRPVACLFCDASIIVDEEPTVQAGQNVRYMPLRPYDRKSIRRNDLVILERESGALKAVKRVVGLPQEKVALREGDLWVDEQRYQKNLVETLAQSVLVAAWEPNRGGKTLREFLSALAIPPSNELPINAHDSHAIVACHDFGIALRYGRPSRQIREKMGVVHAGHRYKLHVKVAGDWSVTCNDALLTELSVGQGRGGESAPWILVGIVDGRLLVGDESGTCFAESIDIVDALSEETIKNSPSWSIAIDDADDSNIDLAMVFRDVVYRGYGDAEEETIPAGPGYVVLGDNVSISDDSRGPAGSSKRWDASSLRGIVLPEPNPLESLLRQRMDVASYRYN